MERFNRTLKTRIRKFVHEDAKNWDRWLEPLLFAVREVPQASTGFSPFELLYGRQHRGVLDALRERCGRRDLRRARTKFSMCWTGEQNSTPWGSSPWRTRTSRAGGTIGESDYAILHREIKVLVLLPTSSSKLLAKWQRPLEVTRRVGERTGEGQVKFTTSTS